MSSETSVNLVIRGMDDFSYANQLMPYIRENVKNYLKIAVNFCESCMFPGSLICYKCKKDICHNCISPGNDKICGKCNNPPGFVNSNVVGSYSPAVENDYSERNCYTRGVMQKLVLVCMPRGDTWHAKYILYECLLLIVKDRKQICYYCLSDPGVLGCQIINYNIEYDLFGDRVNYADMTNRFRNHYVLIVKYIRIFPELRDINIMVVFDNFFCIFYSLGRKINE